MNKIVKALIKYKKIIIISILLVVSLILLSSFMYLISIEDGTYNEDDWANTPYVVSNYTNSAQIGSDGITTEKTKDEIWNSLVAEGSNVSKYLDSSDELQKLMNAELVTQYPKIDGADEDSVNGIIEFQRNKTDGTKITLKYMDRDKFEENIDSGVEKLSDGTSILDYFTLDTSGNVEIAVVNTDTYEVKSGDENFDINSLKDDGIDYGGLSKEDKYYNSKYLKIERNITTKTINYKSVVDKYTMPFQYLWALLVIGEDKDFVLELADLVEESEIVISIYDNVTTTTYENTYKYQEYTKTTKNIKGTLNDSNYAIKPSTPFSNSSTSETYNPEGENKINIYMTKKYDRNIVNIDLTKADVWMIDYSKEYSYKNEETNSEDGDEKTLDDLEVENNTDHSSLIMEDKDAENLANEKVQEARKKYENSPTFIKADSISAKIEDIETIKQVKKINRSIKTVTTTVEQTYVEGDVVSEPKVSKKADDGKENFVSLLCKKEHRDARNRICSEVTDWFIEILENNPDTVNMVDLTKYLLYKVTGTDYGNTDYDFSEYNTNLFKNYESVIGDFVVKTDESNSAPVITEKDKLEEGLKTWLRNSSSQKQNALSIIDTVLDCQEKYNVNAVFMYSLLRNETGIGTANTNWVNRDNNWGSWDLGHKYDSYQENIETIAKGISTGKIYFSQGLITVSKIGEKYCPNTEDYPSQCEGWIEAVQKYMKDLYSSMGIEISSSYGPEATGGEGTIGTYTSTKGMKFNLYLQGSGAPWANEDYGNSNSMAKAGCGPTAAAIIASGYNGEINPSTVRSQIVTLFGKGNHSNATWIEKTLNGLLPNVSTSTTDSYNETKIKQCLKSGGQVWLVVEKCKYTKGAHCIALIDYDENNDKVYVAHGTAKSKDYGWDNLSYIKNNYKNDGVLYVGGN